MKKFFFAILIALPLLSSAQVDYQPLAPIPQVTGEGPVNINEFVSGAITFGIAAAGALSVIFIMIGGIQYMTTDAYSGKSDGRDTIQNAVIGLLLAIGSYAILYTVNPALVKFSINISDVGPGIVIDQNTTPSTTENFGTGSAYDTGCLTDCAALLERVPNKGPNGGACKTAVCYLNEDLIEKFERVNTAMGSTAWQITEAYPPTANHDDRCHQRGAYAGTCADVALKDIDTTSIDSIDEIKKFLDALKAQGLSVDYEVRAAARFTQLKSSSLLYEHREDIKQNTAATGEHAHVEL